MSILYTKDPDPPKLTTSTSKIMTVKGSHNFEIEGYFYRKGMGIGKYIASDAFSVAGHLWEIQFYPDGYSKKDESGNIYISIYVKLVSKCEKDLTVWYELYLLDQNGNRWRQTLNGPLVMMEMNQCCRYGPFTINAGNESSRGFPEFYKRSELDASQFIKDDCLTIQCSVIVVANVDIYMDVSRTIAQPLPSSGFKLRHEQLLNGREGSDVSFEALLRFIYCDDIPDLDSDCVGTIMTQHLLAAADRYGIDTLKSLCESRLCENIGIETVASTLALAEQYGCFQLKLRCFEFIGLRQNLIGVMQTDGFKNLNESCPGAICELLKYVVLGRDFSCDANAK